MFSYLHGHSHFSLLRALGSPKQLIACAQEYGFSCLALTDYDSMYGAIEFYQGCKKVNIKPLIGVKLTVVNDISQASHKQLNYDITLLAINHKGYHQILRLVSDAHTIGFCEGARIDISMIKTYIQDCFITMGGLRSCFASNGSSIHGIQASQQICQKLADIIGLDRLCIEYIVQDYTLEPELQHVNETALGIAHKMNLTMVCNPDYHYIRKSDKEIYELALCIKDSQTLFDKSRKYIHGDYYMMNRDEIYEILIKNGCQQNEAQKLIEANTHIADQCNVDIELGTLHFMDYQADPYITDLYQHYKNTYPQSIGTQDMQS